MKPMLEGPTCARIRKTFAGQPFTALDVEAKCFVVLYTARKNVQALHRAKEIYIADWTRRERVTKGNGPCFPVYRFGKGRDKPKPRPLTETSNYYYKRNPDYAVREAMLKRAKRKQLPGGRIHLC